MPRPSPIAIASAMLLAALLVCCGLRAQDPAFRRGDVDDSGSREIADPITLLLHVFVGDPARLPCDDAADANDDEQVDLSDAVAILQHLFVGLHALPAPFPDCGVDVTEDGLGCATSRSCGDDGGDGEGFVARIESMTVMPLDESTLSSIDGIGAEAFADLGLVLDDERRERRGPSLPLSGKWVEIDGRRFQTDVDGYVSLPVPPAPGVGVPLFWHVTDEEPVVVLDALEVAPAGEEPPVTATRILFAYPVHMDDVGAGAKFGGAAGVAVCTPVRIPPGCPGTNVVACCEDYLGPEGDGKRYTRGVCLPLAVRNFYGSLCYQWSFLKRGKPCIIEGAFTRVGPSCWNNHKYRNCQNLDENDFSFTSSGNARLARFGDTVLFVGRNNTADNSTVLRIDPEIGEFTAPPGSGYVVERDPRAGGWRVDQWNDALQTHYEDFNVLLELPDLDPGGACVKTYKITAIADGLVEEFELRVIPASAVWQGRAKGVETNAAGGSTRTTVVDATLDLWDVEGRRLSGTYTVSQFSEGGICETRVDGTFALAWEDFLATLLVNWSADPPDLPGVVGAVLERNQRHNDLRHGGRRDGLYRAVLPDRIVDRDRRHAAIPQPRRLRVPRIERRSGDRFPFDLAVRLESAAHPDGPVTVASEPAPDGGRSSRERPPDDPESDCAVRREV